MDFGENAGVCYVDDRFRHLHIDLHLPFLDFYVFLLGTFRSVCGSSDVLVVRAVVEANPLIPQLGPVLVTLTAERP